MRVPLKEFMEKLGVDRELHPYETQPWLHYDDEKGITCSAEVRMGPGGDEAEAEIQFLYDEGAEIPEEPEDEALKNWKPESGLPPPPPQKPLVVDGRMQVLLMHAAPIADHKWGPTALFVKGKSYTNTMHDWEGKGCSFFIKCVQAINMGQVPDIDELIEQELDDDGSGGGRRGRVGRKSPKINPQTLLNIKKGM